MTGIKGAIFSFALFSAFPGGIVCQVQSHHCTEEPVTTITRWGGNERIVIDFRDKPVRRVSGTVFWPQGEPLNKALVQIFQREHSDPIAKPPDQEHGIPKAACVTGPDGVFGFSLPAGEYEIRASIGNGVDVTSVLLTVNHWSFRSTKIKVTMHPGT
jgi:hypothetical protein